MTEVTMQDPWNYEEAKVLRQHTPRNRIENKPGNK